jgi:hypothetical protein
VLSNPKLQLFLIRRTITLAVVFDVVVVAVVLSSEVKAVMMDSDYGATHSLVRTVKFALLVSITGRIVLQLATHVRATALAHITRPFFNGFPAGFPVIFRK